MYPEEAYEWTIYLGNGIHPLQWLTGAYLHADIIHLIGNIIFLLAFGLIVEGKIGWWKFLVIYNVIAIGQGFLTQIIMLGSEENVALGASGAIFGLLAICMVWAPKNEITILFFIFIRPFLWDVTIQGFAMFYIGLQFFIATLTGFQMSSEVLHLLGVAVGLPIGMVMVKKDLVDCEGWDLFNVWSEQHMLTREERYQRDQEKALKKKKQNKKKLTPEEKAQRKEKRIEAGVELFRNHINEKNIDGAILLYENIDKKVKGWDLPQPELQSLINLMYQDKRLKESLPYMEDHIKRFPELSDTLRIYAANILIHEERPKQAISVINGILCPDLLAEELKALMQKMLNDAAEMKPLMPEPEVEKW